MTEIVSSPFILTDSLLKSRPGTELFYRTDANAGLNDVRRFNLERQRSFFKPNSLKVNQNVKSFDKCSSETEFKKFEDSGNQRSDAPYRDYDNLIDPVSGFLSAGGDINRQQGKSNIKSFTSFNDGPQYNNPKYIHSIRKDHPAAYPETNRRTELDPPGLPFHQKHQSAGVTRAMLGGWTSQHDTTPESAKLTLLCHLPKSKTDLNMSENDKLAYKYIYTSTTQAAYEAIPFDQKYGGTKKYPPTSAYERLADPVGQTNNKKKTHPPVDAWRYNNNNGLSWDWNQRKPDYYNQKRPYSYCSPNKRAHQLPGYSGCVGAENFDEIDNLSEAFNPFTIKRNDIPKFAYGGAPRDIPGYTGHRQYVVHRNAKSAPPSRISVTQSTHQTLPPSPDKSEHKREATVSKVVTTVPPNNPFRQQSPLK